MAVDTGKLVDDCRATMDVSREAIAWLEDNEAIVQSERPALVREFRRFEITAGKLKDAAERQMCVGVFGPSQSGKSYLISALARRGDRPLTVEFNNPGDDPDLRNVDFVRDINPEGETESTGLVTRFTIRSVETPPGFPVVVGLLTQIDIVRILCNTYYSDCDLSEVPEPTREEVAEAIAAAKVAARPTPVDPLTPEAVYEIQEYLERHFKGQRIVQVLNRFDFWDQIAELAPRLDIADRAALFSLLWSRLGRFTELYVAAYRALRQLGFARTAFCEKTALLPRQESIIDVQTLNRIDSRESAPLRVKSDQATAEIPRPLLTAIVSELTIVIRDKPWDFFEHTDLLDFPGARSRENIKNIDEYVEQPGRLASLFLRGKVAFLFDRYCEDQELTSMLLCIQPSTQEVRTLPTMVGDWVATTHGSQPEDRVNCETALFFVLTKFDLEFKEALGKSEDSSQRWTTRLNESLLNFFGKTHDWPQQWTPGKGFDNTYWLRNPNYIAKDLLDYEDQREVAIRASEIDRINRYRAEYLANPLIQRHFADAEKAWDAAWTIGDGGVTYLAENLRPVCNPDIKARQVRMRLDSVRTQMRSRLEKYFVSANLEDQMAKRVEEAEEVVHALADCAEANQFGLLLRTLQIDDRDLSERLYQVETRIKPSVTAGRRMARGPSLNSGSILRRVLGPSRAAPDTGEDDANGSRGGGGRAGLWADAALELWVERLRERSDLQAVQRHFGIKRDIFASLASEMIFGSVRLRLRDRLRETMEKLPGVQRANEAIPKASMLAADMVNAYVGYLGFDRVPTAERPTTYTEDGGERAVFPPTPRVDTIEELDPKQAQYQEEYCADWIRSFLSLVELNVLGRDSVAVNEQENARLGRLIDRIRENEPTQTRR